MTEEEPRITIQDRSVKSVAEKEAAKVYAEVIIDISHRSVDHPFTYRIPEGLCGIIHPGMRVEVPFGKGSTVRKGYVLAVSRTCVLPDSRVKEIIGLAEEGGDREETDAVHLALWMKERYGSTAILALRTVLPAMKSARPLEQKTVILTAGEEQIRDSLSLFERKHQVARLRLLRSLVETPEQPYSLITEKLHVTSATVRAMEQAGLLHVHATASLRNPVAGAGDGRADSLVLSPEQQAIVDHVLQDADESFRTGVEAGDGVPEPDGESTTSVQHGWADRKTIPDRRSEERSAGTAGDNPETGQSPFVPRVSLIHGITGSGKTEVYIKIIEGIVARGRQAVMLIPEISLTYQTLIRFYRHFGNRVSVVNSTLSAGERADQFERARRGEIDVIIGPRSALFTPFRHIGVIVIDEEHEPSYKNEAMPKYHAREVAIEIARMHHAVVVLGSATPSLESYYHAERGDYRRYILSRRLTGGALPSVHICDMRAEMKAGNRSIFSEQLQSLLEQRLNAGEQSMLFLNRRGVMGFVSCRACGHVMKCPHCDVALTQHAGGKLVCHYCGYTQPEVRVCPVCGSPYIAGFRAGTEQVEQLVKKMYPTARVLRMDADTTARKGSYEKILSDFANEEADILIGTQMIVKGHDFPKVTLVGILLADLSLGSSDYRAAERTFQLLTQAAGRAGRGERPGEVVIQTYEPDHYAIRYAAAQDYRGFYEEEIQYRRLMCYPPVWHMMAVQVQDRDEDTALLLAGEFRRLCDGMEKNVSDGSIIIGPAAAQISRIRDYYRYAVYVKNEKYDKLVRYKDRMEERWEELIRSEPRFRGTQVQFDFDPVNPY